MNRRSRPSLHPKISRPTTDTPTSLVICLPKEICTDTEPAPQQFNDGSVHNRSYDDSSTATDSDYDDRSLQASNRRHADVEYRRQRVSPGQAQVTHTISHKHGRDQLMAIVETEERYDSAFDVIVCPVCGSEDWTHLVFQGVFCTECNTRCLLREPAGDQGFIATFDSKYTWTIDKAEKIPETDEHGARASGKWLGTPSSGYTRYWFSAYVEDVIGYNSDWQPAWERDADDTNE